MVTVFHVNSDKTREMKQNTKQIKLITFLEAVVVKETIKEN